MMTLIYCTSTPDDYCDIYFYRNKTLYKQFKKLLAKLFPFMSILRPNHAFCPSMY